jgi:hypothetical protein
MRRARNRKGYRKRRGRKTFSCESVVVVVGQTGGKSRLTGRRLAEAKRWCYIGLAIGAGIGKVSVNEIVTLQAFVISFVARRPKFTN